MKITLDISWDDAVTLLVRLPDVAADMDKKAETYKREDYRKELHKAADVVRNIQRQIGEQTPNHRP